MSIFKNNVLHKIIAAPVIFCAFAMCMYSCSKSSSTGTPVPAPVSATIRAADISFLPQVRRSGIIVKTADGTTEDMLTTLMANGANTFRIRLWVNPATTASGLLEVATLCQEVRSRGGKIWLTLHYSDTWADPGNQTKPATWSGISFTQLSDSVYAYTKRITALMKPDYIQAGNEINNGLLWPDGSAANNQQFKILLTRASQAIREASPATKIMIHYAGFENSTAFYSSLGNLDYDIIALSYYPMWHGKNMDALKQQLQSLAAGFNKQTVIAETSYPFTLGWNDMTNNIVGSNDQILTQFPATPDGQLQYLQKLRTVTEASSKCLGFCYWGGEWVAYNGTTATNGSSYENQALWDFDYKALPVLKAFKQ